MSLSLIFLLVSFQIEAMGQSAITASLTNPGSSTVCIGVPFELDIIATFDSRLSATDFNISATGTASAQLTDRSASPGDPNGWTYISSTSQDPFNDNLPHDFGTGPAHEVLMDVSFGGIPGGPEDGLAPGTNVLIERIEITSTTTGSLTITISDLKAATTQDDPNGVLFDTITIEQSSVLVTVVDSITGDFEPDCDVDFADLDIMVGQWLMMGSLPADIAPPPVGDGIVNFKDFALLAQKWLEGVQ